MRSTVPLRQSLKTRVTLSTLAIFLVSFWSLSFYASRMLREDMERLLGDQQLSTASYVAAEANHALVARLEALTIVAATISPAEMRSPAALQALLGGLPLLPRLFSGGIVAHQRDGSALAHIPHSTRPMDARDLDQQALASTLREGKSTVGRPVQGRTGRAAVFGMTVPIRDRQGQVIGALMGVTDLGQPNFLDRLADSYYGKSGGYHLLVAPEARLVITATDRSRIMEVLPAPGIDASLDRFFQGHGASGIAVSPLGVEVLSSSVSVPVAAWYVVASLPTAEAFAPIQAMQERMLLATCGLTLLAGALTWLLLRRQLAPMLATATTLATLSDTRQPPQPLPITRPDEIGQLIAGFNRLLDTLAQREEALRIAAIAFECQEGMIVTDASGVILRTNQSFTRILGYTSEEVRGKRTGFMHSDRQPAAFYDAAWDTARREGAWQGEVWHRRRNGVVFAQWVTTTAVNNEQGDITHFVVTHVDITRQKLQEQVRLHNEATHRATLVREVHHRIKNNLQGITGLLRQFAQKHPETMDPMNQAICQVQGISVIHGLQGRAVTSSVRLCELAAAIAEEIQNLWHTPVVLAIPPRWRPCVIAEAEAVPIALVLNELMVNAVKHGGSAQGGVRITLQMELQTATLQVRISNAGQLAPDDRLDAKPRNGLQLIAALMPRQGARIVRTQQGDQVVTLLELAPPVISQDQKEPA